MPTKLHNTELQDKELDILRDAIAEPLLIIYSLYTTNFMTEILNCPIMISLHQMLLMMQKNLLIYIIAGDLTKLKQKPGFISAHTKSLLISCQLPM
jgi:uncharacterized membrane protein